VADRVDISSMTDAEKAEYYRETVQDMRRREPSGPPADDAPTTDAPR